jgi:hypothetical protein
MLGRRLLQNLECELSKAVVGADLNGSSKNLNENFKGRIGKEFYVNGNTYT